MKKRKNEQMEGQTKGRTKEEKIKEGNNERGKMKEWK